MAKRGTRRFEVVWTGEALQGLLALLRDARHAEDNPDWVDRKFDECVAEGIKRLQLFPDLRSRYTVKGYECNGATLRAFPTQIFFRLTKIGAVSIFWCRWAGQDLIGPRDV